MNALAVPLPDHVPPELAYPCADLPRKVVHVNPYTDIIPGLHRGPAIFYGTDILPGPGGGGWVIRRADDLKSVYDNTIYFVKKVNGKFASMVGESWDVIPTELDPPRHTAFRKALNPVFSPKNMGALDALVTERAHSYIAKFKDRGAVEFVKEFRHPVSGLDLPRSARPAAGRHEAVSRMGIRAASHQRLGAARRRHSRGQGAAARRNQEAPQQSRRRPHQ